MTAPRKRLILILGDQLDVDASALSDFDPAHDTLWMAEVLEESTHIPSSKQRTTVFLSAMRHFAAQLQARDWPMVYSHLDDAHNTGTLAGELSRAIAQIQPKLLVMTAPGDWRVLQSLRAVAKQHDLPLEVKDDTHFFSTVRDFAAHAKDRKQLRLEYFYRELRQRTGFLMDGDQPAGGQWNYDAENRESFGKQGPGFVPAPRRFPPDALTQEVLAMVQERFGSHPGSVAAFDWPLTAAEAQSTLDDFIAHRLPEFGRWQDAFVGKMLIEWDNYSMGMSYDINTSSLSSVSNFRGGFEVFIRYSMLRKK
jgi:deoxyribodipyrimidine photolyase-related protein